MTRTPAMDIKRQAQEYFRKKNKLSTSTSPPLKNTPSKPSGWCGNGRTPSPTQTIPEMPQTGRMPKRYLQPYW